MEIRQTGTRPCPANSCWPHLNVVWASFKKSQLNGTCFGVSYLRGLSVLEALADAEDEVVVEGEVGEPHVDHVGHRVNGFDVVICSAGSENTGRCL